MTGIVVRGVAAVVLLVNFTQAEIVHVPLPSRLRSSLTSKPLHIPFPFPDARQSFVSSRGSGSKLHSELGTKLPSDLYRRSSLFRGAAALSSLLVQASWNSARATASSTPADDKRPKSYLELSRKLVSAVKDSLELERISDNDERTEKLTKRFGNAYNQAMEISMLTMDWNSQWRENPRVKREVSYKAITGALQEMEAFYEKNGGDAPLSEEVSTRAIELLGKADEDLGP
eukprot:gnl/TRDRNA2_/TRDRNA2_153922_c1_seq5.p1 gnl/TRDRNA2_/TRDRNA2_153922_c1~~gnl/TRDRNA2_/TRDRNA2_153922_c1_seq5.p1  ORF type:complete len:252 (-),score=14.68 gnl/TRDRNA2_/TRDRNA2_153922_c1_seq5:230-919(-)